MVLYVLTTNIQCFQEDPAPAGAPAGTLCTLLRIAGCIPAFPTRGKGNLGPLLSAQAVLGKERHLLQILLKALNISSHLFVARLCTTPKRKQLTVYPTHTRSLLL